MAARGFALVVRALVAGTLALVLAHPARAAGWNAPQLVGGPVAQSATFTASYAADAVGHVYALWNRGDAIVLSTWSEERWSAPAVVPGLAAGPTAPSYKLASSPAGSLLIAWADAGEVYARSPSDVAPTDLSNTPAADSADVELGYTPALGFVAFWRERVEPFYECGVPTGTDLGGYALDEAQLAGGAWSAPQTLHGPRVLSVGPAAADGTQLAFPFLTVEGVDGLCRIFQGTNDAIWDGSRWQIASRVNAGGHLERFTPFVGFVHGTALEVGTDENVIDLDSDRPYAALLRDPADFTTWQFSSPPLPPLDINAGNRRRLTDVSVITTPGAVLFSATARENDLIHPERAYEVASQTTDGLTWSALAGDQPQGTWVAAGNTVFAFSIEAGQLYSRHQGTLAADGDVETDPRSSFYTNGTAAFSWASDESHSPSHSLKIVSTSAGLTRWMTLTTEIPVTPGTTYAVSAWVKTANATAASLAASYWANGSTYQGTTVSSPAQLAGTQPWTLISFRTTAPAGAAYLRFESRLNGPGTSWTDDIGVSAASASSPPPSSTTPPSIAGTARQGQTLTASLGDWSNGPSGFATQWRRCDDVGTGCVDIPGATGDSYTLAAADVGSTLRVRVTASNTGGSTPVDSAPTAVVAPPPGGPNVAPDPDLEADPAASYSTIGAATFTWATDQAHSPSHSLKIVSTQPPGTLTRWMTIPSLIPVRPGRTYFVTAWLRTSGAGSATLAATFYNGTFLPSAGSAGLSGTNGWTLQTVQAVAPVGATALRVEFRLSGAGTLWADDLTVATAAAR